MAQIVEGKVALMNMEIKGKCHYVESMGISTKNVPRINLRKRKNKKFSGKCNHFDKVDHKSVNHWEHEVNKDKRPKNWKKKENAEVGASNIKVLLGSTKTIESNMKLPRFCSKLICGSLCFRCLMRYQYPEIHLMIEKILCAILMLNKSKKML